MKTTITLVVRAFPVSVRDQSTGMERKDVIVLDKARLQAAQLVGQSSKELIRRLCERAGLTVLAIGKPERREIEMALDALFQLHGIARIGHRSDGVE